MLIYMCIYFVLFVHYKHRSPRFDSSASDLIIKFSSCCRCLCVCVCSLSEGDVLTQCVYE